MEALSERLCGKLARNTARKWIGATMGLVWEAASEARSPPDVEKGVDHIGSEMDQPHWAGKGLSTLGHTP